jgi:hypothetical protein
MKTLLFKSALAEHSPEHSIVRVFKIKKTASLL